jgi:hypothetical protein
VGALGLLLAACGGDDDSSSGGDGTTADAASESDAGGDGGDGGVEITDENGSITFEISGDVSASGDLPFFAIEAGGASLSMWDDAQGGWVAYFGEGGDSQEVIQLNTTPGSEIINYGDGTLLVSGTSQSGCTFDFSQNDADGFKGTVDCTGLIAFDGDEQKTANMTASFDGHM